MSEVTRDEFDELRKTVDATKTTADEAKSAAASAKSTADAALAKAEENSAASDTVAPHQHVAPGHSQYEGDVATGPVQSTEPRPAAEATA